MVQTWVMATNNAHKLQEARSILQPEVLLLSLDDINCKVQPEESGETFQENALIKAKEIAKYTHFPVLSDDSGLCVNALANRPGVYSSRYAGEGATDLDNINKLLFELAQVEDRSAFFISCLCLFTENNGVHFFDGKCFGTILKQIAGNKGFGYDPVFMPDNFSESFAQLGEMVKNKISHRALALKELKNHILHNLV